MILLVIVVGLFCTFVFRLRKMRPLGRSIVGSLGFGILSVLPLVVSTLAVFGLMGWLGISFNMVTAVISGIAVGVGVDFAIHYLHRVRETNVGGRTSYMKLEETTTLAGGPIVFNALSNIAGFSVFLFSSFVPLNQLGLLMVLIMVTCSLGTLLILPPLISIFYSKKALK